VVEVSFPGPKIEPWMVYFLALTDSLDEQSLTSFAERLSIPAPNTQHLTKERRDLRWTLSLLERERIGKPSEIYSVLSRLSIESLFS